MANQVSITNSALIKIGAELIMSLDDDVKSARLAKNRFTEVLDTVLRWHPWNFAIKRVTTSPLTAAPAFGYSYYHQIPSDCLRILKVNPENDLEYRIEGRLIATDTDSCEIKYIRRIEDLTEIDSICAEAVALYLAWDLSYSITQSLKLKNQMLADFKLLLRKAKGTDAQEEPAPEVEANLWLDSREYFNEQPLRGDR